MGLDANKILTANVNNILKAQPEGSRLALSRRMKVGDGTLGRIVYGTGNPQISTVERIAKWFNLEAWQLLKPDEELSPQTNDRLEQLLAMTTPRSRTALERIQQAAQEGRLTEDDLVLLEQIARRFME